jgi:CYTH domain
MSRPPNSRFRNEIMALAEVAPVPFRAQQVLVDDLHQDEMDPPGGCSLTKWTRPAGAHSMSHKAEIELKLELENADLRTLANSPVLKGAPTTAKELVSVYFDTPKWRLRKHGFTLRVRRDGNHQVQTVKRERAGNGAALSRDEWECNVEGGRPDLDAARGTALKPLLTKKARRALKPVLRPGFETPG